MSFLLAQDDIYFAGSLLPVPRFHGDKLRRHKLRGDIDKKEFYYESYE